MSIGMKIIVGAGGSIIFLSAVLHTLAGWLLVISRDANGKIVGIVLRRRG